MTFTLDTSAYSAFNRGDERLKKWFLTENQIIVPLIVVGELRAGFAAGTRATENEHLLQRFLDAENVNTTTLTHVTTSLFADIYLQLRQNGTPIGTNDMWIAALCLETDCLLLTLDSDFSNVSGLKLATLA
jgi:tRNA(fMet)-specific endonuclease VapC